MKTQTIKTEKQATKAACNYLDGKFEDYVLPLTAKEQEDGSWLFNTDAIKANGKTKSVTVCVNADGSVEKAKWPKEKAEKVSVRVKGIDFGHGVTGSCKFVAKRGVVTCRSRMFRDIGPIKVSEAVKGKKVMYHACLARDEDTAYVIGKTPDQAFAKAAKAWWRV